MSDFMAKFPWNRPLRARPDGGSTSLNALAFSTLLSSQETDAHRQVRFRVPVGATLELYPRDSFVSTTFPESFRKVADSRILQPPASGLQRLRARTVAPKASCLVAPRVPVRTASRSTPWRSVPLGARRTLRVWRTLVKSEVVPRFHTISNQDILI